MDRDVETAPTPAHIKRLILLLNDWGYREIAVRLAKGLSYTGVYLPAFTHPVIPLPSYPGPAPRPIPLWCWGQSGKRPSSTLMRYPARVRGA